MNVADQRFRETGRSAKGTDSLFQADDASSILVTRSRFPGVTRPAKHNGHHRTCATRPRSHDGDVPLEDGPSADVARSVRDDRREGRYARDVKFERISTDPAVMGGMPCIRGTRIPVSSILGYMASGMTHNEILADFQGLTLDDLQEALRYGAAAVSERELPYRESA